MYTLKPLSIVTSYYADLSGSIKKFNDLDKPQFGLFIVLRINDDNKSVQVAKITSDFCLNSRFLVSLPQRDVNCLRCDSILQLDKQLTLFSSACNVIGEITNSSLILTIMSTLKRLSFYTYDCIKDRLPASTSETTYVSPNSHAVTSNNYSTYNRRTNYKPYYNDKADTVRKEYHPSKK